MRIVSWIILFLMSLQLRAQVTVEAKLDSTNIRIGEQVHLKTMITANANQQVVFPNYETGYITNGVEVLDRGTIDTLLLNEGKRLQLSRSYTLTSFDSALYYIPPVEVIVDGKKYHSQNRIGLKVGTVPVDTLHVNEFPGPHEVVDAEFEWNGALLWWSLALWVGLIAIVLLLIRLSVQRPVMRRVVIRPKTPPHKLAISEIEKMKGSVPDDEVAMKSCYMRLTDVLRTYIQERFGFSAREMTSSEIIERLKSSDNSSALRELHEILETADLVKFAKYKTTLSDTDRNLIQAMDFVNTTKPATEDEAKPIVQEIRLDEKKQRWAKIMMGGLAFVLIVAEMVGLWLLLKNVLAAFL